MLAFIKDVFSALLHYSREYNDYKDEQLKKIGYIERWY
jgi:hypothetical protein